MLDYVSIAQDEEGQPITHRNIRIVSDMKFGSRRDNARRAGSEGTP